ncbi:MAG TPA: ABC transporter permease subunit, partial [Vicinamibacteria bacterium]
MTSAGLPRQLRTVVAIARADFRERTRGYAFLVALALTAWLGWLASDGTLRIELGPWRGVLDSAWVGGSLAIIASTFLSLMGGWLVRGTIARDRATGVGEILATTPLTRSSYLLGKWLSHTVYLGSLAVILALLALVMLARNAEAPGFDLAQLWLPMALIALPSLAFVAGLAVAFELVPWLRGGFGNVAWLFAWTMTLMASIQLGSSFDFSGLAATRASLRADLVAQAGVDEEGIRVGGGPRRASRTFVWQGFD